MDESHRSSRVGRVVQEQERPVLASLVILGVLALGGRFGSPTVVLAQEAPVDPVAVV
jgi:hypothetical protein